MENIKSMATKAFEIAKELDRKDGKEDNKISAKVWKNYAVPNFNATDNVSISIGITKAKQSIWYYLKRESNKSKESQSDIATRWFNELQAWDPNAPKQENNGQDMTLDGGIKDEVVVTPSPRTDNAVSDETDSDNPKIEQTEIEDFAELAKMTKTSSAKASDEVIDNDILDQAFDNVIRDLMRRGNKPRSVLLGTAKDFIAAADAHDVDTFTLMGISMIESTYGTSKAALEKNNVGGLRAKSGGNMSCQTVCDSINVSARVLQRNVYDKGLETINSVGMRGNYCCADNNTRATWVNNVTFFANTVRNEYNRLLAELKEQ